VRSLVGLGLLAAVLALAAPARADHARYGAVLTIDPESARALMAQREVAPIDVRPEAEYRAGRLPGARSLPLPTLKSRLAEVPRQTILILYGDGPIERVLAAYHLLRAERFTDVYVLEDGLEGWRRLGYRVER
jgi:rhodanese-related sulfurtransferase